MTGKGKAKPNVRAMDAEATAAEAVPVKQQATRTAKAAASPGKADAKKAAAKRVGMGGQADRQKNAFGIAASASKATAVSRAIISRARGGRNR
jgi:hypothetical protein